MIHSADDMIKRVEQELAAMGDASIRDALLPMLVHPAVQRRAWDYGQPGETLPCWLVMEDKVNDTAIVYSDFGFGPRTPWGLVMLSRLTIGDDSGWFPTLERAFCDSFAGANLRVWELAKRGDDGTLEVVERGLTIIEASEKCNRLKQSSHRYVIKFYG